jgi:hypothetical protein
MMPSPFFEAKGGSGASRRLLLVSPLFPPDQQVGALRWQKMARYVAERGWELDVITFHPDCLQSPDWGRLSELPPGTRLYGVRAPVVPLASLVERVWAWLRRIRPRMRASRDENHRRDDRQRAGGRPDSVSRSEIGWFPGDPRSYVRAYNSWFMYAELKRLARDAFLIARDLAGSGKHDAIISSGPPHAAHEAARLLSRDTGIPLVIDLRDLWSLAQRCSEPIASPLLFALGRRYERRVVDRASLIVVNTQGASAAMARAYPEAAGRIITVMNGFDDDPLPAPRRAARFIIAYAGSIYLDRDPGGLFRAARRVIDELNLSPGDFGIEFIGVSDWSVPLTAIAEAEGVAPFVHVGPSRPRAAALEFLAEATMLVILPQDTDLAIPAKVFEYMRFDAWLLALAERDSATGLVLRGTAADVISSADIDGIAAVLKKRYREYAAGTRPRAIAADPRLSRQFQAGLLVEALEQCVRPAVTRSSSHGVAPMVP